jgi:Kef-type K+ transport system membrane component KefB
MATFFLEFSSVFLLIFIVSYILSYFKQPIFVGYVIGGILLGPLFFNILSDSGYYQILSHVGIAFLLFLVGLHLNISLIRDVGKISLFTGIGQIVLTMILTLGFSSFFSFSFFESFIIAIALSFSSTIVIVKLLSDSNALDTTYGKISLGFLLVQDFVAIIILLLLNSIIDYSSGTNLSFVFIKLIAAVLFAILLFLITKPLLRFLFKKQTNSELLFLFSITWCLSIASLYDVLGFSLEIGALFAGASLASSKLHYEIAAKIKPLRDFFIILFFIVLGSEMFSSTVAQTTSVSYGVLFSQIVEILPIALFFSLLVIIGNPIIVFIIMTIFGYTSKISFNAGLAVSQISEFSLIISLLVFQKGLISEEIISILTLVMLITMLVSSYFFYHKEKYYSFFSPLLHLINKHKKSHIHLSNNQPIEAIIVGLSEHQVHQLEHIQKRCKNYVILEHDFKKYQYFLKKGLPVVYGDLSNIDFLDEFDLMHLKFCVSLEQDEETSNILVENIRKNNNKCYIIVSALSLEMEAQLYKKGADYVIIPHHAHHEKAFSKIRELFE